MLIKCTQMTKGPVCEVGAGFYSTSVLHWLSLGRLFVSYEADQEYFHYARKFQTNNHRAKKCSWDYKEVDYDKEWSVVLIDHRAEPLTRGDAAMKFKNATFLVLHDTEFSEHYGYDKVYPLYKYRYDNTEHRPHTTVLSNTIDVTKWN